MDLQGRKNTLAALGNLLRSHPASWQEAVRRAEQQNPWFTQDFIKLATENIVDRFLQPAVIDEVIAHYRLDDNVTPVNVGIVMAGNIPMVGFHDLLCVYLTGQKALVKPAEKDTVLMQQVITYIQELDADAVRSIHVKDRLNDADAYIATGSNNTGRYFEQYFGQHPHIIRKNKTSVAILDGSETPEELAALSADIHTYFGFGCRNVTKLYLPQQYDFVPLLNSFNAFERFNEHTKYRNNYEYQLSILMLNNTYYMTNGSTLLTENKGIFSPPAHVWYEQFDSKEAMVQSLQKSEGVQAVIGHGFIPFGGAQCPGFFDYADGVDTIAFLLSL